MPVNLNIVSARLSAKASIGGARASRSIASAEPKMTLKTTTCRISPSTTALAMFSGKMWSTISCQVRDAAAGSWLASTLAGSVMPAPARLMRDRRPADEERQRGDDLEVDERLHAHPPDLAEVGVAGDADDQRREEQRRDDGADQPQEDLAEEPERDGQVREEVADLGADDDGDENPERERPGEAHARYLITGGREWVRFPRGGRGRRAGRQQRAGVYWDVRCPVVLSPRGSGGIGRRASLRS